MHAACEDALIAASLVQDFSCISSTGELVCIAQGLGNRECRWLNSNSTAFAMQQ